MFLPRFARIIPGPYLIVRSSLAALNSVFSLRRISVIPCPNLRIHDKLYVM